MILEIASGCYGTDGQLPHQPQHSLQYLLQFHGANLKNVPIPETIVLKTTTLDPINHTSDKVFMNFQNGSYWNRVKLQNIYTGIDNLPTLPSIPDLRLSLYANTYDEWFALLAKASKLMEVKAFEFNISCPNATKQHITDWQPLIDSSILPVYFKISTKALLPANLHRVAGVVCGNSFPHELGGISGLAVKNINLTLTREYSKYYNVIGCGGIVTKRDVLQYIQAGASKVQLGSHFLANSIINPA